MDVATVASTLPARNTSSPNYTRRPPPTGIGHDAEEQLPQCIEQEGDGDGVLHQRRAG